MFFLFYRIYLETVLAQETITKEDITKAARTLKLDTVYIMDTKKEEA